MPFFNISAPSIVSGMSGESEKKIREVFEEVKVSCNGGVYDDGVLNVGLLIGKCTMLIVH